MAIPTRVVEPLLLGTVFLDLAAFGSVLPDVQTRLESFGARGWLIGLVLASYFVAQIAASPLWGRLSDRTGRKAPLVLCFLLSAASFVLYAQAHDPLLILASRVVAGLAGANVALAQAEAAAGRPDAERTAALGRLSAATSAGLIVGPALGGWLSSVGGATLLGTVAAGISGAAALTLALFLPGVRIGEAREAERVALRHGIALLRGSRALAALFLLAAIAWFSLACLEGTFGRLIHARLGFGPREYGLLFGYEALLAVLVPALLLGPLSRRLAPVRLLQIGYALQSLGLGATPFATGIAWLATSSTLYGLGAGLTNPTVSARAGALAPPDRQGEVFGLLQASRSIGFLIGPILGGILYDLRPALPYLLAATVLLMATLLASWLGIGTTGDT